MPEITIYGPPQSTYTRTVRMLCEEKGAPYQLNDVAFGSPAHLALHPFGKVPVCVCDGETIFETLAICSYLDEELPGAQFVPAHAAQRARMLSWASAIIDYSYPVMIKQLVLPRLGVRKLDASAVQDAAAGSVRQLGIIDTALDESPFLAGESLSVADLLLAPIVDYLMAFEDVEEKTAQLLHLRRWYEALSSRASFKATNPPPPPG